ncbi:hypothetical protein [Pontiella sp.]|uniref:hypothetical protein n=1 Tax=Pontiella sp. TaxID=2837462 RepID=UPI0035699117
MTEPKSKRIVRLLGVGFDWEDGHVRMTKGESYDVLMGSHESHEYIQQLLQKIEDELKAKGLMLDDLNPEEFSELVQSIL